MAARGENPAISPARRALRLGHAGQQPPHQDSRNPMLSNTPRMFVGSTTFTVTGLTCGHCQRAVTDEIGAVAGVESVRLDPATGTFTVTVSEPVDRADIAAAVETGGGHSLVP
jgi:copper chaperone CopZ